MISETLDLLRLWEPGMTGAQLAERAVETGMFSRTTARRAKNLAAEMFAPRYLVSGGQAATRLKYLVENRFPHDALAQLFFLQTCRAHPILSDFLIAVYWPKYSAGASSLNKQDAVSFIHRAFDTGILKKRWSASVIDNVSGYLLGCCIDFGLLGQGNRKDRPIQRFSIRPEVALYLAHDLHFAGLSDGAVVHHADWRLFGLEDEDVVRLLKGLGHDGHFLVQAAADLVQISWRYRTMEECLHALAAR